MGLLNKLKPFPVDLLLYSFQRGSEMPEPITDHFPFSITFSDKDSQYIIEEDGKLIHRSKLFTKSLLLKNFGFKKPFVAVGDCMTDDAYRGKAIYPNVIQHILIEYRNTHDVYMLVAPTNIASINGIEKAGLQLVARLQCLKIGPIYLRKTRVKLD